ncbi:hypothetical protein BDZ89DRAFT_314248 [Hymenopellis radicata]|nr:hypothetical protein BDZ89DRAFT_314248 [Hymenopellis radicata]
MDGTRAGDAAVPDLPCGLPFPTRSREIDQNGQYVVEYLNIPSLRNKNLEGICKYLGLKGYSGKPKHYLVDALTKFSALGNNGWNEHFTPGARLAHLAPREGTKRLNHIQKRRKEVLGIDDDDRNTASKGNRPVRSKDTRSQEEIQAPLAWAERVLARHEKTKVTVLQHSHLPTAHVEDTQPVPADTVSTALLQELKNLRRELTGLRDTPIIAPYIPSLYQDPNAMEVDGCGMFMQPATACYDSPDMFEVCPTDQLSLSSSPLPFSSSMLPSSPPPSSSPLPSSSPPTLLSLPPPLSSPLPLSSPPSLHLPSRLFAPPPSSTLLPSSSLPSPTEVQVVSSTESEHSRVIVLGGGRPLLQCTDADIPNAPLFKNRSIEEMARMWDDDLPLFWSPPESALQIKGHAIPLKLWPMVYSKGKGRVKANWAHNKSQWSVWRFNNDRFLDALH